MRKGRNYGKRKRRVWEAGCLEPPGLLGTCTLPTSLKGFFDLLFQVPVLYCIHVKYWPNYSQESFYPFETMCLPQKYRYKFCVFVNCAGKIHCGLICLSACLLFLRNY